MGTDEQLQLLVFTACNRARKGIFIINREVRLSQHSQEVELLSCVQLFEIPWTIAYQAPPSMAFSRQEYWSGLPFPFPGDLPNPRIELWSPALQADVLPSEPPGKEPWEKPINQRTHLRIFKNIQNTSITDTGSVEPFTFGKVDAISLIFLRIRKLKH